MARPRKNGLDYFPHDTGAASDEKIEAMMALYGNNGYAFYFLLLERIFKNGGVLDIHIPGIRAAVAENICSSIEEFEEMMKTAIELNLFEGEEYARGRITSRGIKARCNQVFQERERKRKFMDVQNPRNNSGTSEEIKENKIKLDTNVASPTPQNAASAVISLPLNDGTLYGLYQEDIDRWCELYPAVDVLQEVRKMVGWLDANEKNRKTLRGVKRFITNWLSHAQDKAHPTGSGFIGREVRSYDGIL